MDARLNRHAPDVEWARQGSNLRPSDYESRFSGATCAHLDPCKPADMGVRARGIPSDTPPSHRFLGRL
jgi:hypothetical protein